MAGFKPPKMPKGPKAPKIPGGGKPPKLGKLGGDAKKKFNKKKLLKILIPLLLLAAVGVVLLILFVFVPQPEDTVQATIDAAFLEDEDAFKAQFTPDSVDTLETSWKGVDIGSGQKRGSWDHMMEDILTKDGSKPVILEDETKKDDEKAIVLVEIDGKRRAIHLVKVEDHEPPWLIDLLVPINIEQATEIAELDPEVLEESGEDPVADNEMWWEEREAAEGEDGGGMFSCIGCTLVDAPESRQRPIDGLLMLMLVSGAVLLRRRRRTP